MKKNLVMFLFIALFTFAMPTVTVFATETKEVENTVKEETIYDGVGIYQNCMPAVLNITYDNGGGSGFFIDINVIVTNYHVIKEIKTDNISISDMYGNEYTVKYVLGYNDLLDLALIEVNETSTTYLKRNTHTTLPGSLVYSLGNPYGIPFVIAQGLVGNPSWKVDWKNTIVHTAPISSGNSGGPLVNSYGEVLGINAFSAGESDAQNLNYAINISDIDKVDVSNPRTFTEFVNRYNIQHKVVDKSVANVGDVIILGSYEQDNNMDNGAEEIEWIVLDNKDDELFVVSKYCLDVSCWNSDNKNVTWKDSEYRKFLSAFYDNSFTDKEKESIMKVNTDRRRSNNPQFSSSFIFGDEDTYDYVFLPSSDELEDSKYVNINGVVEQFLMRAEPTEYCKSKGIATWGDSIYTFYATRSIRMINGVFLEGLDNYITITVKGELTVDGPTSKGDFGKIATRPAMWIKR